MATPPVMSAKSSSSSRCRRRRSSKPARTRPSCRRSREPGHAEVGRRHGCSQRDTAEDGVAAGMVASSARSAPARAWRSPGPPALRRLRLDLFREHHADRPAFLLLPDDDGLFLFRITLELELEAVRARIEFVGGSVELFGEHLPSTSTVTSNTSPASFSARTMRLGIASWTDASQAAHSF